MESISSQPRTAPRIRLSPRPASRRNWGRNRCAKIGVSQSFLYNAIFFFTYPLVLDPFYGVPSGVTPLYLTAFAVANLADPLAIGHFFDTIGRKKMIASTYILSGLLLAVSAIDDGSHPSRCSWGTCQAS